jgi:histidine triad (HIT) family protein
MAEKTLFEKIIDREIPADLVFEDDQCIAFRDINPQAPLHALVVPKKPLAKVADAGPEDREILGHLLLVAAQVARQEGYEDAFRLVINNGAGAGQTVFHVHVHILGGRAFGWPPG